MMEWRATFDEFKKCVGQVVKAKEGLIKEAQDWQRRLQMFEADLEKAQIVGNADTVAQAGKGINHCREKIGAIDRELSNDELQRLAEQAWADLDRYDDDLRAQVRPQWEAVQEARNAFIREVAKLGMLRRAAEECHRHRKELVPVLNRSEGVPAVNIRGQHEFEITLDFINKVLRQPQKFA